MATGKRDEGPDGRSDSLAERFVPDPRGAAIATMALLAFGVVVGAATGPLAQSAGVSTIVVKAAPEAPEEAPLPVAEEPPEAFAAAPAPEAAAASEAPPESTGGEAPPPAEPPPEEFPAETLPAIEHVFVVVLGDRGYEEAFGKGSNDIFLAKTLRAKGELLFNYYAVAQGNLANEIALVSGQGPTPATVAGCAEYANLDPATVGSEEQVEGEGCVFPEATQTLPGQLAAAKETWKAYGEGGGCPESTPRNPFAYFHSLADGPECTERSTGLDQLATDLESAKTTPSFAYIAADAEPEQPFLERIVPEIEESQAYESGLIAITFAQAPQSGPNADSSACCGSPEYPNLPPPSTPPAASGPVKPSGGGGRVGMLLLSPYVEPGSTNDSYYYNHFSLLRSVEELFGLPPIGYGANPALTPFDSAVYNLGS